MVTRVGDPALILDGHQRGATGMRTANDIEPGDVRTDGSRGAVNEVAPSDLTLDEAAVLYEVSRTSLRRKIKANKLSGAYRAPGSPAEWRIPRDSLESMGVRPRRLHSKADANAAASAPEAGLLSGLLIEMVTRERARRAEAEAEKTEANAKLAGLRAESEEIRAQLIHRQRDLVAAHNRRAAAEVERESAQMEAWSVTSRLTEERRRREEAEAAAAGSGETWRSRIGWSFFGVAATLGALALVASMLLDTLLFDRGSIAPDREEPGGAPATSELAVAGDGARDGWSAAAYAGTFAADRGTEAAGNDRVEGSTAQSISGQRGRSGRSGHGTGRREGTPTDRGPGSGAAGGSNGANDAPASAGSAQSGSGSTAGDVGSAAGETAGEVGTALGDAADHVGDAVNGVAGAAENCVCGAVGEAAGAVGAVDGGVGDTVAGTVSGAAEAASSTAGGALPPLP
jgi:hypothetical protein